MINHTMLENYQATRYIKPQVPSQMPSQIILINKLQQEISQFKLKLAFALSVNQFLVQQACTHIENQSTHQTQSHQQNDYNQIKIEDNFQASSISDNRQKYVQKDQKMDKQMRDKNETKNIPKNYGKAILSFIQKSIRKYSKIVKPILEKERLTVNDLLSHIKRHKKQVNSINYLKQIWGYYDKSNPILKCIRILSYIFMRKHCLSYIFNSRVKNYFSHIKYRRRIIQGIEHPQEFTCIKQF